MIQRRSRSTLALFGVPLAAALVIGLGALRHPAPPPDSAINLTASLGSRRLTIMRGDSVVREYDVAVGHPKHPTPQGGFTIRKIVWNPGWVPPDAKWAQGKRAAAPGHPQNPMKLVKIFFQEPDYYIHGTDQIESLGDATSHGCLRMHPDDAYSLARYLMEHGGQPRDESWFYRVLHFRAETQTVILNNPIALTITN
jgi:murein L,D-transpeptidase YcbB/YkuD